MDGPAPVSQLVQKVFDFIGKVLVFSLHDIQLLNGLIPSGLQAEQLAVVVAALLLAGLNFGGKIINLGLPFPDDLFKRKNTRK
jgi:hypothetical protein